jgi:DNA-binding IclR family transcriptional regulator
MERRDLWSRLSAARTEEEPLVERLLADLPTIQETGLVITPDVSEVEIEGIATAVTVDGRTVAAVACIGDHGEINERKDEIVAVLREARGTWAARG